MARESDLGNQVEAALATLRSTYGYELWEASADIGRILAVGTELEGCDKIKKIPQGEVIREHGVAYRCFTDA